MLSEIVMQIGLLSNLALSSAAVLLRVRLYWHRKQVSWVSFFDMLFRW